MDEHPTFPSLAPGATVDQVLARFGNAAPAILSVFAEAMEGSSELSTGERELIATYTSHLNKCQFCECSHAYAAIALGIDRELVRAIRVGDTTKIDAKMLPLFDLVRVAAQHPSLASKEDIEAVLSVGWSEQTAFDILFVVAAFSLVNTAASVTGLMLDEASGERIGALIASSGYMGATQAIDSLGH